MVGTTLDLQLLISPDSMAVQIANQYDAWIRYRDVWMSEKRELRNYIFATDTRTTSNSRLPWKNSTTLPKLCQIRDNLHANYYAALFPNSDWLKWEGNDEDSQAAAKRMAIQAYMENKVEQSGFKNTVSQLIYDYIDYGNIFATTVWVEEKYIDPVTGEETGGYLGPKAVRIPPPDVVFNPTAAEFDKSPKLIRTIRHLGEIIKENQEQPDDDSKKLMEYALGRAKEVRKKFIGLSQADIPKIDAYRIDGFSDIKNYYSSNLVEVLQFYGTLYDIESDKLYDNYIITVIDRSYVLSMKPNPAWRKNNSIKHAGWRLRPDNLYAMGPLDNLVGMQYRIDHLENLKADAFDLIAFPVLKIKGYVEDFIYEPNARIYVGDEGDVEFMSPDKTALSANQDIQNLMSTMEEMAGAPKEAMGIRTPGEKTAYEVSTLANAASRIFDDKARYLEEMVIDTLLNDMLELARRNLPTSDLVRVMNSDLQVVSFLTLTKDDLSANGKLKATGAQHFAKRNQMVQNLTNFANSKLGSDPAVTNHMSGKKIAKIFEGLLDLEKYGVVQDNIRIIEQVESQRIAQQAQQQAAVESQTPTGLTTGDQPSGPLMAQANANAQAQAQGQNSPNQVPIQVGAK